MPAAGGQFFPVWKITNNTLFYFPKTIKKCVRFCCESDNNIYLLRHLGCFLRSSGCTGKKIGKQWRRGEKHGGGESVNPPPSSLHRSCQDDGGGSVRFSEISMFCHGDEDEGQEYLCRNTIWGHSWREATSTELNWETWDRVSRPNTFTSRSGEGLIWKNYPTKYH